MVANFPLVGLSAPALVGVFVLLLWTGRLVTLREHRQLLQDRNEWREAHRISEASRAELAAQVAELLEHARTANALLSALPRKAQR